MATCRFCGREFGSRQGVYAHLKSCERYLSRRRRRPQSGRAQLPTLPQVPFRQRHHLMPEALSDAAMSQPEILEELAQLRKEVQGQTPQRQAEHRARQEKIRKEIQDIKWAVVDVHQLPWKVPPEARAAAKIAIERKLQELPVLELPYLELYQIASAVRDGIYKEYTSAPTKAQPFLNPEVLMPKARLLTGWFVCPDCDEAFELDEEPEHEAVCEDCAVPLEELDEDDEDEEEV